MSTYSFGNVDLIIFKRDFEKQFRKTLTTIQYLHQNQYYREACQKFRDCIKPDKTFNTTRLPVYSAVGLSPAQRKINCVLSKVSYIIQLYWEFYKGKTELAEPLKKNLQTLEEYIKNGLDAYKISGKKWPGYFLERK